MLKMLCSKMKLVGLMLSILVIGIYLVLNRICRYQGDLGTCDVRKYSRWEK